MGRAAKSLLCLALLLANQPTFAQDQITTEKRFQDVFVTAGYSTALGAALGAAMMGLSSNPAGRVRYIAVGASIGFISGSLLGTYVVLAPVFVTESVSESAPMSEHETPQVAPDTKLAISPVWDLHSNSLKAISAQWTLATF